MVGIIYNDGLPGIPMIRIFQESEHTKTTIDSTFSFCTHIRSFFSQIDCDTTYLYCIGTYNLKAWRVQSFLDKS